MKKDGKWYQSVSNWIVIIACIILVPILLMNLSIMFQAKTDKNEIPSVFGYRPFIVLSGSMEPGIHKGDMILTKIVDATTLGVNDVIAFKDAEGTVTTHRIIDVVQEKGETYFITKGDNNGSQDRNLVSLSDVKGLYIGRIPGIGSIMNSLSEPTTIIIVILGITMIFVIGFVISNKKQREEERKELLEYKKMKEQQRSMEEDDERRKYLEFKRQKEEYARRQEENNNQKNYQNRERYENKPQYRNTGNNRNYENNRNNYGQDRRRNYENKEQYRNNTQNRNSGNYQNNRSNYNNSKNNYKK